ncbi:MULTISPECIES: helix-turn-helix domain-containing protein [Bacillus]|uniref:helix-turn-helix domain-containing protein n=1 Tax=Bacillus TaxID=1386 RepID=UPI000B44BAAB|nr:MULTISPECIES: helix-turn-helix transcriptional regulator [Bacillus]MCA1019249.1 helix-turn-helix transcriptional regulator [Bacillus stratosphericus]MBR0601000.1 helix-turn-helix transcriptional regulator [Bacillus safensis]MCM3037716.1 helix-turn-helix transcriptional regulator [Bacillus pumilus]MCY7492908.1 helix-turn-helix transcriptional regulator [Bacillus safensis]MED4993212.1 helix-turn-helix transcriptional regulator [Bacillus safensis]
MIDLVKFGTLVKKKRKEFNLSQTDCAKMLGFTTSYICKIENAKAKPTLQTIEQISKKIGVKIDIFFET